MCARTRYGRMQEYILILTDAVLTHAGIHAYIHYTHADLYSYSPTRCGRMQEYMPILTTLMLTYTHTHRRGVDACRHTIHASTHACIHACPHAVDSGGDLHEDGVMAAQHEHFLTESLLPRHRRPHRCVALVLCRRQVHLCVCVWVHMYVCMYVCVCV